MKPVSSWQFSAPLEKVDLPRIADEAAAALGTQGAIKVVVETGGNKSVMVLASSELAVRAWADRGTRLPEGFLARESTLIRASEGLALVDFVKPLEASVECMTANGVAIFPCANEASADALIVKLVDRVVVRVEAF